MTARQFGYARASTGRPASAQRDVLVAAGVDAELIYIDELAGPRESRPGLASLLADARAGDAVVVIGIDGLGRSPTQVMTTFDDLQKQGIAVRSLREDLDTDTAVGRVVAGILASLGALEREEQRERRAGPARVRRERGQQVGRPRALSAEQRAQVAERHAGGESVADIAESFGVGRDTVYRALQRSN